MPRATKSNTPKADRDEWRTHQGFYDSLKRYFKFQYDFAATEDNALAPLYYTKEDDAINMVDSWWQGNIFPSGFLNPPFSKAYDFLERANEEIIEAGKKFGHGEIVCLVRADSPETGWWRDAINLDENGLPQHEIIYLYPRLPYRTPDGIIKKGPEFASSLIIMRPKPWTRVSWLDWRQYIE